MLSVPMVVISLITLIPLILYVILIVGYTYRWKNYPEYTPGNERKTPSLSVIIPFHNEQTHLSGILYDLSWQDYPLGKTEILLVNDQSIDRSVTIIQEYCKRYKHFRLIHLPDGRSGKKEAIHAGIQSATHDLIITTDADCRADKHWLSTVASFYNDFSPSLIIGLVVPEDAGKGLFGYFQQIESISLTGAGAASAMGGKPIYCSGANLCYPKDSYLMLNDPMIKSIASGDDTFLLLQLKKCCRTNIRVLKSKQALVSTKAEASLKDFFRQRSRWISKSVYYRDREILYSALVVLLTNMAIGLAAVFLLTGYQPWLLPVMLITKLLLDGFFISDVSTYFGIKFRLPGYIVSGIIYPFYLVTSIVWAFLAPVDWKGRKQ